MMSEVLPGTGYNIGQRTLLNKDGQEMSPDAQSRYECVQCHYILRSPYQLVMCGDRICKECLPNM